MKREPDYSVLKKWTKSGELEITQEFNIFEKFCCEEEYKNVLAADKRKIKRSLNMKKIKRDLSIKRNMIMKQESHKVGGCLWSGKLVHQTSETWVLFSSAQII